jgi:sporulation protein YlmC with PRC-barrel domain
MKKATITFITSAALAFAIPLYAADEPGMKAESQQKAGVAQQQTDQMQSGQMITAEKLKGMEVVSQKGEELGEIKKVMIDQQSGEIHFVTISKGGILGIGGEEVAAPLSAFEISDEQARLTVDQSKLENVPQQKAEATDSDYQRDLETHYGVAPAWEKGDRGDTTKTQQMEQGPTEPRKVDTQN